MLFSKVRDITPRITGHGEKDMTKTSDVDRAPVHTFDTHHGLVVKWGCPRIGRGRELCGWRPNLRAQPFIYNEEVHDEILQTTTQILLWSRPDYKANVLLHCRL